MKLEHRLERTLVIRAERSTVFRYFTDTERFARWWGEGSKIEPRPGGQVRIRYPNGVTASGTVVDIVPDKRFVFTYGYDDPGFCVTRDGAAHEIPQSRTGNHVTQVVRVLLEAGGPDERGEGVGGNGRLRPIVVRSS